jgi:hypothetical protein
MFKKKKCKNCNKNIKDDYDFCPSCGYPIKDSLKEWGMLGKEDLEMENPLDELFTGISGKMINKMIGTALKVIEKEMQKEDVQQPHTNIRLSINGKEINLNNKAKKKENLKVEPHELSKSAVKKISTLPKEEPKTSIRRFSNKIVYEIKMPEVESMEDISIMPLENSIEVKALGKSRVYFKLIPVKLPITSYNLSDGKLTIEFDAEN